jgi:hypothetical protein
MSDPPVCSSPTATSPQPSVLTPGKPAAPWFRRWMCLDESEATFAARGFCASSGKRQRRLELIGRTFIKGYNCAIESGNTDKINTVLEKLHPELRGFSFEGASMACSLMDALSIRSSRFEQVLLGHGEQYKHLCWVGVGWACARLRLLHGRFRRMYFPLDPLLGMLVYDGWGFHHGYFFSSQYLRSCGTAPATLKGSMRSIFDQGFGRSLWFSGGADPSAIKNMVSRFSVERQADMWSGVGLACCYAGGAERCDMESLLMVNPELLPHLRQGVTFGATARVHSGNITEDTALAAKYLCSSTPQQLAEVAASAKQTTTEYQEWRGRIRRFFM